MLSRLVITFLPRSRCVLISWLQSPSAVILEPPKIKSDTVYTVSPTISHEVMGPDAMIFVFWMLSFKPTFSLSTFTFIKRLFSSYSPSAIIMSLDKCKLKQWDTTLHPFEWPKSRTLSIPNASEELEQQELWYFAVWNVKGCSDFARNGEKAKT